MSYRALAWVDNLRDAELAPAGRLLLYIFANAANEDQHHECYVRQETLELRTNLSSDTIQRRLKDLARAGYIFVRRGRASDGCLLVNRYVLLLDDDAKRFAESHGWASPSTCEEETTSADCGAIQAANCGMDHAANETEPCRTAPVARPQLCGVDNKELTANRTGNRTIPSLSPQKTPDIEAKEREVKNHTSLGKRLGSAQSEPQTEARARLDRWAVFEKRWPWQPKELPGHARSEFLQLSDAEQQAAIDAISAYIVHCLSEKTKPFHAKNWLNGEGWKSVKANSPQKVASFTTGKYPIRFGTPEYFAWREHWRLHDPNKLDRNGELPTFGHKQMRVEASQWPPSARAQPPPSSA